PSCTRRPGSSASRAARFAGSSCRFSCSPWPRQPRNRSVLSSTSNSDRAAAMDRHSRFATVALILVLGLGLWQVGAALVRIDLGAIPSSLHDVRTGRTTGALQRGIE